jgi:hypothetical protein
MSEKKLDRTENVKEICDLLTTGAEHDLRIAQMFQYIAGDADIFYMENDEFLVKLKQLVRY